MKKIAFIIQRYGLEINGGAEYHCRVIAERLTEVYDVTVLTSCAKDYLTWENEYAEGTSHINGVKVHRFAVTEPRNLKKFHALSRYLNKRTLYQKILRALGLLPAFEKMLPEGSLKKDEEKLIDQLDAFVFKDELDEWCNKGFDYIGAPWIRAADQGIFNIVKRRIQQYIHTRYNIQKNGGPSPRQLEYKIGNGGFSLRRVHKFYELCLQYREMIAHYNKHDTHFFNEDVFWSVEVNRKSKQLNIPGYKIALRFAVELHPKRAFAINKNQLPFGCHAWDLTIDFWRPIFEQYGYKLNNKNGE